MPNGAIKNHLEIHCHKLKTNIYTYISVCKQIATMSSNFYQIYLGIWLIFFSLVVSIGQFWADRSLGRCILHSLFHMQLLFDCCIFIAFTRFFFVLFCFILFCFLLSNLQLAIQLLFIGFNSCLYTFDTHIFKSYSHICVRILTQDIVEKKSRNKETFSQQNNGTYTMAAEKSVSTVTVYEKRKTINLICNNLPVKRSNNKTENTCDAYVRYQIY